MYAERREFDNSDCNWGVERDGVWDKKRIETNRLNHVKLFLVLLKCNTLIKINYGGYGILGNLSFFLFLSSFFFFVAVTKQVPGVGYMTEHLQQKSPF